MTVLTEDSLSKLSKTDLVALVVNLQDKKKTMTSNLNEKVSNLTEEVLNRGRCRTAATSKMERFVIIVNGLERFVIIVNGWKPLTIITKRSILDVAAALDPPLP